MSNFAPVSEAVGEAMSAAMTANAAYAAEMAALQASETAAGAGLAAFEAELAAEEAFITSLELAEAMELYGGPLGWIAAAFTGTILLGTAITVVMMMNKIAQSRTDLLTIEKKISDLKPPPPTTKPMPPSTTPPFHVDPAISDIVSAIPDGPLVDVSDLFNCKYRFPWSRCNRRIT